MNHELQQPEGSPHMMGGGGDTVVKHSLLHLRLVMPACHQTDNTSWSRVQYSLAGLWTFLFISIITMSPLAVSDECFSVFLQTDQSGQHMAAQSGQPI